MCLAWGKRTDDVSGKRVNSMLSTLTRGGGLCPQMQQVFLMTHYL